MKYDKDKIKQMLQKHKYLLIVIIAGVVLLMWPSASSAAPVIQNQHVYDFSTNEMEERLSEALSQVHGVGRVEVVLTLRTGTETVFHQDSSTRSSQQREDGELTSHSNDTTDTTVVLPQGGGVQAPAVVMQRAPEFMGALIICDGGDDAMVRLQVINAVAALTGIPTDRITVVRMAT